MIEYVIPENPDNRVLQKASSFLSEGGIVVVPTDTNWVACCDPFVSSGVDKIYRLKGEQKSHHFSALCNCISTASNVAYVPDFAYRMIRNKIPGHWTFIFEANKKMTKAVKASKTDKEVGIRFPPSNLVNKLIQVHGQVLLSTNLGHELLGVGEDQEIYSYLIEEALGNQLQMIIDPGEYNFVGPSTVVRFLDDSPELVRVGAGDPALLGL